MGSSNTVKRAACTIVSANYFAYAVTLAESFAKLHPDYGFYILVVDKRDSGLPRGGVDVPYEVVYVEDLGIPNFRTVAFKYDILELNTNVKPTFLKYLISSGATEVIYFDPDIYLFSSVDFIFELLEKHTAVVTPHATSPVPGQERPSDQDFLATGTFNLGFIGVNNSAECGRLLDWWEDRCLRFGYQETRTGLFVDQKWIDLAPCYFDDVFILRHRGCNVSNWNLHEREITSGYSGHLVNNETPLIFFHFSGVDINAEDQISKHQERYDLGSRPELRGLFTFYRSRLQANGSRDFGSRSYGFASFSNGQPISWMARRAFAVYEHDYATVDPFDAVGPFYKRAKAARLLASGDVANRYNRLNFNAGDWRVRVINSCLRMSLRVLGGNRYAMLMKYLSFISIIRNQHAVLQWSDLPKKESAQAAQALSKPF